MEMYDRQMTLVTEFLLLIRVMQGKQVPRGFLNNLKSSILDCNAQALMGCKNVRAAFCETFSFLLLEDPQQAHSYCARIESGGYGSTTLVVDDIIGEIFTDLLLNGRNKMAKNWDIKLLCAFNLSTLSQPNHCKIDETNLSADEILSLLHENSDGVHFTHNEVEQLLFFSKETKGKESIIISPFRLYLFMVVSDIYKISSDYGGARLTSKIIKRFYSTSSNNSKLTQLPPLMLILRLICDGLLASEEDIIAFDMIHHSIVPAKSQPIERLKIALLDNQSGTNLLARRTKLSLSPMYNQLGGLIVCKGECLIINQTEGRPGSEKDEEELINVWRMMGCNDHIYVKRNSSKSDMIESLKAFNKVLMKTKPDFMVVIILSHGRLDKRNHLDLIQGANSECIAMDKIKRMFVDGRKCPTMVGKPKLFVVQACRGRSSQNMIDTDMSETDGEEEVADEAGVHFATKSWFFVFQSTIKGFASSRNPLEGSIFIQTLCKELQENGTKQDLATIASSVNQKIMDIYKIQAPVYENQLGNFLYFKPPLQKT